MQNLQLFILFCFFQKATKFIVIQKMKLNDTVDNSNGRKAVVRRSRLNSPKCGSCPVGVQKKKNSSSVRGIKGKSSKVCEKPSILISTERLRGVILQDEVVVIKDTQFGYCDYREAVLNRIKEMEARRNRLPFKQIISNGIQGPIVLNELSSYKPENNCASGLRCWEQDSVTFGLSDVEFLSASKDFIAETLLNETEKLDIDFDILFPNLVITLDQM